MEESLSTTLLAIAMFVLGVIIGLVAVLFVGKPTAPQQGTKAVIYGGDNPITVTISPPCQLTINSTGIYNSCTGLVKRLNGTLANYTIVVG